MDDRSPAGHASVDASRSMRAPRGGVRPLIVVGFVFAGIALLLALHAGFVYLPVMHDLFGSAPLDAIAWAEATLAALIVVLAVAAEKAWRRRTAAPSRTAALR